MQYDYYEKLEHKIIRKLFKDKAKFTPQMAVNDLFVETESTIIIGEVKTRTYNHNRFDWFIEKDKLVSLLKLKQTLNKKVKILYINYFNDDYIIVWDLINVFKNYPVNAGSRLLPKHSTEGFSRYKETVLKEVYYLKNEYAIYMKKIKLN